MRAYDLGNRLRRHLLASPLQGRRAEPARLQALVSDLCGDDLADLRPALHALSVSRSFHQAIGHNPPLPSDPALLAQFQAELNAVFTAEIAARMGSVLQGLLALPEADLPATSALPLAAAVSAPVGAAGGPSPSAIVLLGLLGGALVVGMGGLLVWLGQLRSPRLADPPPPVALPAEPQLPVAQPPVAQQPEAPDPADGGEQLERAVGSVERLYAALSAGNHAEAQRYFTAGAADQFTASFFDQFARVEVVALEETERQGDLVTLTGQTRFVYPDGSRQDEQRQFRLDTSVEPPLVLESRFERVLSPRQ